jgi:hypothetical protein
MYLSSKSWAQLEGGKPDLSDLGKCDPLKTIDGSVLVPCGAFPTSVFNDTFTFAAPFPAIQDTGIAIPSYAKLYSPPNPDYETSSTAIPWLSNNPLFPGGQEDERFINWMHMSPFPKFQKVWGKTDGSRIEAGKYTVQIHSNFPVESFGGRKSLVIGTVGWAGAKNEFLAVFFFVIFSVTTALAGAFGGMHVTSALPLYKALARGAVATA